MDKKFEIILSNLSKEDILEMAKRDNEKPLGALLTWCCDYFNKSKVEIYYTATEVLKHYGIEY